jgi:hypothetical protein
MIFTLTGIWTLTLTDIPGYHADALVYGAPVFNFNLAGLVINIWNRKTDMSGYFRAKEEGKMDEWLKQSRAWKGGSVYFNS